MNRAYSILNVKTISDQDGERVITGLATTPTADRMGDTVQPMGAKFKLPMPLLWQHDHEKPVGHVEFAQPNEDGIPFTARIAKITEPGTLKDRVDEAWQSVKAGLVSAVSIGFNPLKYKATKTGIDFQEWEWFELSLVTIPANAEANIFTVKSLDHKILESKSCADKKGVVQYNHKTAGASAKTATNPNQSNTGEKMNIVEQLAALRAKQESHAKRMQDIMAKSVESGETLDNAAQEEFDNLSSEVESMDAQIKRFTVLEKNMSKTRTEVKGNDTDSASNSRLPSSVQVKSSNEDKSLGFAEYIKAYALNKGNIIAAEKYLERTGGSQVAKGMAKAAVAVGSTTDPDWIGSLVGEEQASVAAFLDFQRSQSVLAQINATKIGFYTPWVEQVAGGAANWVGEGKSKPVTSFKYNRNVLTPTKVAAISVLTMEALRDSSMNATQMVRDSLASAINATLDADFIDPAKAAVAGVSPASITNGQTTVASTGNTHEAVLNDLKAGVNFIVNRSKSRSGLVMIVNAANLSGLEFMTSPLGQVQYPSLASGTFMGIRVVSSDYVPLGTVVLLRESDVLIAEAGGMTLDISNQATIEMSDNPEGEVGTLVHTFQQNCVALLAEKTISWAHSRANPAVYVITGVNWGAAGP